MFVIDHASFLAYYDSMATPSNDLVPEIQISQDRVVEVLAAAGVEEEQRKATAEKIGREIAILTAISLKGEKLEDEDSRSAQEIIEELESEAEEVEAELLVSTFDVMSTFFKRVITNLHEDKTDQGRFRLASVQKLIDGYVEQAKEMGKNG